MHHLIPLPPVRQGQEDAWRDLGNGKLNLRAVGEQEPWVFTSWRILHERYGIGIDRWTGQPPSREQEVAAHAYDQIMEAEIRRRFGADTFERTNAEAKRIEADLASGR